MNDFDERIRTNRASSEQLLLAQLAEMNLDWRYLDNRIETAIRLYLAVLTLVVSIVGSVLVPYQGDSTPENLLFFGAALPPFLLALGVYTIRRVKNASIARSKRQLSINLIKLYFQAQDPHIEAYLPVYVQTPKPLVSKTDSDKKAEERRLYAVSFPDGIAHFVLVLNSIFTAVLLLSVGSAIDVRGLVEGSMLVGYITLRAMDIATLGGIVTFIMQKNWYENSKGRHIVKNKRSVLEALYSAFRF